MPLETEGCASGEAGGTWRKAFVMQVLLFTQDTAHSMHSNLAVSWGLSQPHFAHLSLGDIIAVFQG